MGKATKVWIDGRLVESLTEAKERLNVHAGNIEKFMEVLHEGGLFNGYAISLHEPIEPPPKKVAPAPVMHHCDGRPLLAPGYCVHRLGVDHGDHWR